MDGHDISGLHKFAESIGLAEGWFQGNASYPHYDVSRVKRAKAIKAGAIPVTVKEGAKLRLEFKRLKEKPLSLRVRQLPWEAKE